MNEVKVSIIVPVYNVENYLRKCLLSLTDQTMKEIEIICINDGSTDNSGKILKEFSDNDRRINVITQENEGVSAARNKGIAVAKGEYIAFVDSDDYVDNNLCEEVYLLAKKNQADIIVYGGVVWTETETDNEYLQGAEAFFRDNLNVTNALYVKDSIKALAEGKGSFPLIWNKFYKRELVIASGGFDKELALGEDEAFLFEIYPLAERIMYIDRKYYHYLRNRSESATDRLVMDFEKRAFSNLKLARIVKLNWEKKGVMKQNEDIFCRRYVDLLFDNAHALNFAPELQSHYMQQVFELLNQCPVFAKMMIDEYYEKRYLQNELNTSRKEVNQKQNEICTLINEKNIMQGQVSVLKDVMIGSNKNVTKRVNKKTYINSVKNSIKRITANYENIANISNVIKNKGYKTYAHLKKAYGEDCIFFACAFAGLGDAYIVSSYVEEWTRENNVGNYRFLLGGKAEKKMVEDLFPFLRDRCVLITQQEHEWLRNLNRIVDGKCDFFFFHHYDYMQPHLQITEFLQGYKNLNMKDLYLYQMGLSAEKSKAYFPVARKDRLESVEKLFTEYGLQKKKTVIIAPYSSCLGVLSEEFWMPIVEKLKKKGYSVCCNVSKNEKPLKNTIGVFIEFKDLLQFVNDAGNFIGFRSGLCDVVSSCKCKMAVIHLEESNFWGKANSLSYVGLKNMGLREKVLEVTLQKDQKNMNEVQNTIINNFN